MNGHGRGGRGRGRGRGCGGHGRRCGHRRGQVGRGHGDTGQGQVGDNEPPTAEEEQFLTEAVRNVESGGWIWGGIVICFIYCEIVKISRYFHRKGKL